MRDDSYKDALFDYQQHTRAAARLAYLNNLNPGDPEYDPDEADELEEFLEDE
jgi:hypothetical protein